MFQNISQYVQIINMSKNVQKMNELGQNENARTKWKSQDNKNKLLGPVRFQLMVKIVFNAWKEQEVVH